MHGEMQHIRSENQVNAVTCYAGCGFTASGIVISKGNIYSDQHDLQEVCIQIANSVLTFDSGILACKFDGSLVGFSP